MEETRNQHISIEILFLCSFFDTDYFIDFQQQENTERYLQKKNISSITCHVMCSKNQSWLLKNIFSEIQLPKSSQRRVAIRQDGRGYGHVQKKATFFTWLGQMQFLMQNNLRS